MIISRRSSGCRRRVLARAVALYEVGTPQRVLPMEGVRGLAVLLVFFVHFDAVFGRYLGEGTLGARASSFLGIVGNSGVDIFFVLSGYLIYGLLMRRRVQYRSFVARRVERIYPAFLCVLAVYLLLSWLVPSESRMSGRWTADGAYLLANVLLLPGLFPVVPIITVAWSLSYEFFFYLSLPALVATLKFRSSTRAGRLTWCLGIALAGLLAALAFGTHHVRLVMFAAGILLAETLPASRTLLGVRAEGVVLGAFVLALAAQSVPGLGVPKVAILGLATFWLLQHVIGGDGVPSRIFRWTPLRWLGNMSYSYYLLHGLALKTLGRVVGALAPSIHGDLWVWAVLLPLSLVTTLAASTVLFALVEKPWSLTAPRRAPVRREASVERVVASPEAAPVGARDAA